ncbi:hypothetical protein KC717_05695 [Candidatus Dojkabacteria bacterium]|uniref:PPM-type phosphatase domain-containing protein n=1 Tax=Candidatus Dojkabacteria bacterium TaxID=2099670 RepID=A0A955L9P6_9BACT|nr:hypothetical protein [Candidatus Dojkabacteria bacterium]
MPEGGQNTPEYYEDALARHKIFMQTNLPARKVFRQDFFSVGIHPESGDIIYSLIDGMGGVGRYFPAINLPSVGITKNSNFLADRLYNAVPFMEPTEAIIAANNQLDEIIMGRRRSAERPPIATGCAGYISPPDLNLCRRFATASLGDSFQAKFSLRLGGYKPARLIDGYSNANGRNELRNEDMHPFLCQILPQDNEANRLRLKRIIPLVAVENNPGSSQLITGFGRSDIENYIWTTEVTLAPDEAVIIASDGIGGQDLMAFNFFDSPKHEHLMAVFDLLKTMYWNADQDTFTHCFEVMAKILRKYFFETDEITFGFIPPLVPQITTQYEGF